ncbi:MAG TPA: YeeE/YedE thiosulfate transporter family protein [Gemmatimonadaceae bacterium]|nr:YeeE/YedE thiosulfate transporter family protein [Gemmatimonadaceae bacterium]
MSSTTAPVTSLPASRVAPAFPPWARLGILFGLLSAASIALYGPIGVSGTYPRLIGAIARAVNPGFAAANPYLVKMGGFLKPESMLVIGLVIGGFLASRFGQRQKAPSFEVLHASETTPARRYANAFAGGVLILFGARLAGGCTSGHIISGMTQLSLSGMVFAAGVFVAGIATAKLLKRGY